MSAKQLAPLFLLLLVLVPGMACGSDSGQQGAPPGGVTADAAACTPERLETLRPGTLTVATDSPAHSPYFEDDDPSNGRGFESAVAYAIAGELGFTDSQVEWVKVPFRQSFAPGPKQFDLDLNQVSITPDRRKNVTFSTPYYTAGQAVVVAKSFALRDVPTLARLRRLRFGVAAKTTSVDAVRRVVAPTIEPRVLANPARVVAALRAGRVEAAVFDLPTAIDVRDRQLAGSRILGRFEGGAAERWGAVMSRNSPLAVCVDRAIGALAESGRLGEITDRWMGGEDPVPVLR